MKKPSRFKIDQMSSSDPLRPTPSRVDHIHLYPITTRPGPGAPESPHQPPPVQSHPQVPPTAHPSDRSQNSTSCVEDWYVRSSLDRFLLVSLLLHPRVVVDRRIPLTISQIDQSGLGLHGL